MRTEQDLAFNVKADRAPRRAAIVPRGLKRTEAAAYVGVSPSLFDDLVRTGRMPQPKLANSRTIWDRNALDEAFEALPDKGPLNPFDSMFGGEP